MPSRREFLSQSTAGALALTALSSRLAAETQSTDIAEREKKRVAQLRRISAEHPRLHFDGQGLSELQSGLKGRRRKYAENLVRWVERNRDWTPKASQSDPKFSNTVLEEEGAYITNVALAAAVTQRADLLALARRRTMAMCDAPISRFSLYSLGMYVASLARAYDWLYDKHSDQERAKIRDRIETIITELYNGSDGSQPGAQWWAPYPLHHDYWIPVGGFGEAALALLGETDDAPLWAARAERLFDVSFGWLGDDGAWHEGVGDWCYAVAPLLIFYSAWQSRVGEDLHDRGWIRNTARYRLYHWLPNDEYVGLNDSFRDGRYGPTGAASCHLLRRLASVFDDPHAQWLADRDERYDLTPGGKGVQRAPHEKLSYREELRDDVHADSYCQAWNLFWYDGSVEPKPPTNLPLAHHFENADVAIVRTGWDSDNATVVSFSCGPLGGQQAAKRVRQGDRFVQNNLAHAHADYNAITLFANGEYLVVPSGYARRSSRFQNTVSVNGGDFLVDPGLEIQIVAFVAQRDFTYVVGDATNAFPKAVKVKRYRRHLWVGAGRVIVFDDIQLHDRSGLFWNNVGWTLHSDPRSHHVTADGTQLLWHRADADAASLRGSVLEPDGFAWEHARLESVDGVAMLAAHRLVRPEWYSDRIQILAEMTGNTGQPCSRLVRHKQVLGVMPPDPSDPAIAFALTPSRDAERVREELTELHQHDLTVFGHDPTRPEAHARFPRRTKS